MRRTFPDRYLFDRTNGAVSLPAAGSLRPLPKSCTGAALFDAAGASCPFCTEDLPARWGTQRPLYHASYCSMKCRRCKTLLQNLMQPSPVLTNSASLSLPGGPVSVHNKGPFRRRVCAGRAGVPFFCRAAASAPALVLIIFRFCLRRFPRKGSARRRPGCRGLRSAPRSRPVRRSEPSPYPSPAPRCCASVR